MSDTGIDPSEFNMVSQNAHWEAGLAWVWGAILLVGPQAMWWAFGIGIVAAGVKEFWYDEKYETIEVRGSSLEDFTFYCVGLVGAVVLYWLRVKLWGAA